MGPQFTGHGQGKEEKILFKNSSHFFCMCIEEVRNRNVRSKSNDRKVQRKFCTQCFTKCYKYLQRKELLYGEGLPERCVEVKTL